MENTNFCVTLPKSNFKLYFSSEFKKKVFLKKVDKQVIQMDNIKSRIKTILDVDFVYDKEDVYRQVYKNTLYK